jgi:hypothetical protein
VREFEFSLFDNALDSLNQGISFVLTNPDDRSMLKLAVLLIAQAVELTLKERLSREHPSLVFTKVEQVGLPNAHTVSIEEAKKRLESIAKIQFQNNESKAIENISDIRNKIQHYKIAISHSQALIHVHSALAFLIEFIKSQLGKDIKDLISKDQYKALCEIEYLYDSLKKLADARIQELRSRLEPSRAKDLIEWDFEVIECPQCWEEFYIFSLSEDISECQLCSHTGGFVACYQCGTRFPSGSLDLHFEGEKYILCENCWNGERDD